MLLTAQDLKGGRDQYPASARRGRGPSRKFTEEKISPGYGGPVVLRPVDAMDSLPLLLGLLHKPPEGSGKKPLTGFRRSVFSAAIISSAAASREPPRRRRPRRRPNTPKMSGPPQPHRNDTGRTVHAAGTAAGHPFCPRVKSLWIILWRY
jgi:hypothetical protein